MDVGIHSDITDLGLKAKVRKYKLKNYYHNNYLAFGSWP